MAERQPNGAPRTQEQDVRSSTPRKPQGQGATQEEGLVDRPVVLIVLSFSAAVVVVAAQVGDSAIEVV